MATLSSSYQYIGRTGAVTSSDGSQYYVLLFAKTAGDISTGKHKVSVQMYLASTLSTFYDYNTNGSVTVAGISAISWSAQQIPGSAWKGNSLTAGGITYPHAVLMKEGSVTVDTGYGVAKDIAIKATWNRISISGTPPSYVPYITAISANITVTLPMIAGASPITGAKAVTLGEACGITWAPHAASFRYRLKFSLGGWSHTTDLIHPNTTGTYTYSDYVLPLEEIAPQMPDVNPGQMDVTLYTYLDSEGATLLGETQSNFSVTVPDTDETRPEVAMVLTPTGDLPEAFSGLYIQGKTKVNVSLSAEGKLGAGIASYSASVAGVTYEAAPEAVSGDLSAGEVAVIGYAKDTRGITGTAEQTITVLSYGKPQVRAVEVYRCNENGDKEDTGTALRILATRLYSSVEGKNGCAIRYRWKEDAGDWQDNWTVILAEDAEGDTVDTGPILLGLVLKEKVYQVQVEAVDSLGSTSEAVTVTIPSEKVYIHEDGARNAVGLGKYNTRDNGVDSDWDFYMNGHKVTELPDPEEDSDAVTKKYADQAALRAYPVGSIYISVNETSPADLFGGTWERLKDTFLLAAGDKYAPGDTGGAAEHTLTEDEMPEHTHQQTYEITGYSDWSGTTTHYSFQGYTSPGTANAATVRTRETQPRGGGLAHNNMPPYLAVYMWVRLPDET